MNYQEDDQNDFNSDDSELEETRQDLPDVDEDEEDEEDYDDDDGRTKKRPRSQFVIEEAEVSEDEDLDDEEDEELLKEDGFVQDIPEEDLNLLQQNQYRRFRELDRRRQQEEDEDAEVLAAKFKQRYSRIDYAGDEMDIGLEDSAVRRKIKMPTVDDPKIWAIKCKQGKEKDIMLAILRKNLGHSSKDPKIRILSAYTRSSLEGFIYIEAWNPVAVKTSLENIPFVYTTKLQLVPVQEMAETLKVEKQELNLKVKNWVRCKRGKYAGDLGQVVSISDTGESAVVRLVPRLDLENDKEEENEAASAPKRKTKSRPIQRLFDPDLIRSRESRKQLTRRPHGMYQLGNDQFKDGYLEKEFKITNLLIEGVNPTLDEISKFAPDGEEDEVTNLATLAGPLLSLKGEQTGTLHIGDNVDIVDGALKGEFGVIREIKDGFAIVTVVTEKDLQSKIPLSNLRKRFRQGDHVRVINGVHKDETGMVVHIGNGVVTLISDTGLKEINVFSKDIREATDATIGSSLGGGIASNNDFQLHDCVELLDQHTSGVIIKIDKDILSVLVSDGHVTQIPQHQARQGRHDHRRAVAADKNGVVIRVGDRVKEALLGDREGSVIFLHRGSAFVKCMETFENSGIFVVRSRDLESLSAKQNEQSLPMHATPYGGAPAGGGFRGGRGGGPAGRGRGRGRGRDPLIGQTVIVRQGPHKGKLGIVKESMDMEARVEFHSDARIMTLSKSKLNVKTPDGGSIAADEFSPPSMGAISAANALTPFSQQANRPTMFSGNAPHGSATPFAEGGKTPGAWDLGSKTPAAGWDFGSKTPAAAWDLGSKTPAAAWDLGSKTPAAAWDMGSKTPAAWDAGSKTPAAAWDTGNKTPAAAWDAGNKTPAAAWDAGNKTPAQNVGNRSPTTTWNAPAASSWDTGNNTGWESNNPRPTNSSWDSNNQNSSGWGSGNQKSSWSRNERSNNNNSSWSTQPRSDTNWGKPRGGGRGGGGGGGGNRQKSTGGTWEDATDSNWTSGGWDNPSTTWEAPNNDSSSGGWGVNTNDNRNSSWDKQTTASTSSWDTGAKDQNTTSSWDQPQAQSSWDTSTTPSKDTTITSDPNVVSDWSNTATVGDGESLSPGWPVVDLLVRVCIDSDSGEKYEEGEYDNKVFYVEDVIGNGRYKIRDPLTRELLDVEEKFIKPEGVEKKEQVIILSGKDRGTSGTLVTVQSNEGILQCGDSQYRTVSISQLGKLASKD